MAVSDTTIRKYEAVTSGLEGFCTTKHGWLCLDCARRSMFKGSYVKLIAVGDGTDTSCIDAHGDRYEIWHEDSMQYEDRLDPDFSIQCVRCSTWILEPMEDY